MSVECHRGLSPHFNDALIRFDAPNATVLLSMVLEKLDLDAVSKRDLLLAHLAHVFVR
jgi:hypothetical protein